MVSLPNHHNLRFTDLSARDGSGGAIRKRGVLRDVGDLKDLGRLLVVGESLGILQRGSTFSIRRESSKENLTPELKSHNGEPSTSHAVFHSCHRIIDLTS